MNAVVIMAKAPVPKEVKTRLIPPLSPEEASSLYHYFLLDKITQVKSIKEARHFVAYTPVTSESFFRSLMPSGFILINQVGADLGERLANVSKNLFDQGAEKVIILDSDSPNLPTDHIREGLSILDEVDVALGPCEDGGYYLIGMRSFMPELFRGIPWSTSEVAELTMKKAKAFGLSVSLLPEWYDVDTMIDLERLKRDMDSPVNNCYFCENTYRSLTHRKV
ncbi:MAG: TIGR04282 family arsenosugar biosynthesis glycosyltransferase [Candidatus Methanoperedens sp.]|nr:TIGR04282 family arsenosugar biosynthesis glycosyltransferase [Candidatus Methanoperedens sp.]